MHVVVNKKKIYDDKKIVKIMQKKYFKKTLVLGPKGNYNNNYYYNPYLGVNCNLVY